MKKGAWWRKLEFRPDGEPLSRDLKDALLQFDSLLRRLTAKLPYIEATYPALALAVALSLYGLFNYIFGTCESHVFVYRWSAYEWSGVGCYEWSGVGCKPFDIGPLLQRIIPPGKVAGPEAIAGRGLWVFITGLNHLACLTAIPVAFYTVRATSAPYPNPPRRTLTLLGIFIAVSAVLGVIVAPSNYFPILFQTLKATAMADVHRVADVTWLTAWASYTAAILVTLTTCVVLWPPPGGLYTPLALAERMRLLRNLFYFGTAMLVVISLRVAAEVRWANDLLKAWHTPWGEIERDIETAKYIFSVVTSVAAGVNTVLLAAVYLPAAFILSRRARCLVGEITGKLATLPEREKWLESQGLSLPASAFLGRTVAILAPLLAGPIGDWLGKLFK